jgi:hypothetical protein
MIEASSLLTKRMGVPSSLRRISVGGLVSDRAAAPLVIRRQVKCCSCQERLINRRTSRREAAKALRISDHALARARLDVVEGQLPGGASGPPPDACLSGRRSFLSVVHLERVLEDLCHARAAG